MNNRERNISNVNYCFNVFAGRPDIVTPESLKLFLFDLNTPKLQNEADKGVSPNSALINTF